MHKGVHKFQLRLIVQVASLFRTSVKSITEDKTLGNIYLCENSIFTKKMNETSFRVGKDKG